MPLRLIHESEEKSQGYGADQELKKIFYINQDRAVKRNTAMEKKMKPYADKYGIERFTAVKPEEARHKDIKLYSTGHQNAEVNGKKLATYFSHWLILKHIANQTNGTAHDHTDVYFVLEDDIEFKRKDWIEQVMCHINKLPADWDMYKFGYWDEVSKERAGSCGTRTKKYETLVDYNPFSCFQQTANVDTQQWMGNQGYAVTPSGAAVMLKHLEHMPVMDVDGAMMPHGGQRRYAPNNYYSRETILGHDTEVNMATVRNIIS
jgi:GR25 family glycosyltransferase involved in LPS biosynthesis